MGHGDRFVVVGGGISGVTCAEYLSTLDPDALVTLLTASPLIKSIANFKKLSKVLEEFDVEERNLDSVHYPNVSILQDSIEMLDPERKRVQGTSGKWYTYTKLCLCTGARPAVTVPHHSKHVYTIRDTDSVKELRERIVASKRVVVIGNGGIALELVHELEGVEVTWIMRNEHIGNQFFDAGAATFLINSVRLREGFEVKGTQGEKTEEGGETEKDEGHIVVTEGSACRVVDQSRLTCVDANVPGTALGPQWHKGYDMAGQSSEKKIRLMSGETVSDIYDSTTKGEEGDFVVRVVLGSGETVECDVVVCATGVVPNAEYAQNICSIGRDGGIMVNSRLETSVRDVYAAGDCCTAAWVPPKGWFQMRLWTQARQFGLWAAQCMTQSLSVTSPSHSSLLTPNWLSPENQSCAQMDFCFELFAHVTRFFGFKCVLLGQYNAQGLDSSKDKVEYLVRYTEGKEYIKVVLCNGRMVGTVLIGQTDLEETFENLILNETDLSAFGEEILNPDIDIEDYFD